MKIWVAWWHPDAAEKMKAAGFEDRGFVEGEIMEIAQKLYACGLHVMLVPERPEVRSKKGKLISESHGPAIYCDTTTFKQR